MTILKHEHKMGNLEQIIKFKDLQDGETKEYATWVCWSSYGNPTKEDCDYHEYRYIELPTVVIKGVVKNDLEKT